MMPRESRQQRAALLAMVGARGMPGAMKALALAEVYRLESEDFVEWSV